MKKLLIPIFVFIITICIAQECEDLFTFYTNIPPNITIIESDSCFANVDIQALDDLIDLNELNEESPLHLGYQTWMDGRLRFLLAYMNPGQYPASIETPLDTLPESIGNLTELSVLNLQWNNIEHLPSSFNQLVNLTSLFISSNGLQSIISDIGSLSQLYTVDLGYNELTFLPESISNLSNLSYLYLFNNELTSLPESFCNLDLDWSGNDNNWLPYFAIGGNQLCDDVPVCVATSDNFEISMEQFYYSFPVEALQDCDEYYLLGDINQDYTVNITDIIFVIQIILENIEPTEEQIELADVNYDGSIDISDIIIIVDMILENPNTITDYDGNVYQTVQIGEQLWMSENLKVTHYNNGDAIQYVQSESSEPNVWENLITGAYGYYNDDLSHQETYGNLYNWYAVDDDRGVCPEGWHVPSDDEWKELEMALGMSESDANSTGWRGTNEGSKLAGNAELWNDGNLESSAEFGTSGFTALPSGYRYFNNGSYYSIGNSGYFWSSSESNSYDAWYRVLAYDTTDVYRHFGNKRGGFSVRCVRN